MKKNHCIDIYQRWQIYQLQLKEYKADTYVKTHQIVWI